MHTAIIIMKLNIILYMSKEEQYEKEKVVS